MTTYAEYRRQRDAAVGQLIADVKAFHDDSSKHVHFFLHGSILFRKVGPILEAIEYAEKGMERIGASNGRDTSAKAAETIPRGRRGDLLMLFSRMGPMDDNTAMRYLERQSRERAAAISKALGEDRPPELIQLRSVTAARNHLMIVGLLEDSGERGESPSGRPTIVWQVTDRAKRLIYERFREENRKAT